MKSKFVSIFLLLATLVTTPLLVQPVFADEDAPPTKEKFKSGEYISLTVGLTQDKTVSYLPSDVKLRGDYKGLVKIEVASATKTIRFTPLREGTGTLTILDNRERRIHEFYITVRKSNLHTIAKEMRSLLGDIEGIEIKIVNNKVVVDGQILLPRDMNRIFSVVTQYGDSASSIVTLSPVAQKKIAEFIERDINSPEIHVRAVNEKFILEGVANDEAERQKAEIIAKTYVPDAIVDAAEAGGVVKKRKVEQVVINLITIRPAAAPEPGKIIQLVVHYVEMQKDYSKGFRFQWTPSLSDKSGVQFQSGAGGGGIISQITGTINNLLPKLNWAKQHGHARVLQSSSLIVQDGQQGNLKSETRIPYQTMGPQGQLATDFEDVGMTTVITPKIMGNRSDSINLKLDFGLKALLSMSEKGPVVSRNTINTVITVRSGQSAAVGGLVSNNSGTDYNKLPKDASDNPIISLYASKSFRRNQSQFVVFVTPIIKSSASAGSDQIKEKFRLND